MWVFFLSLLKSKVKGLSRFLRHYFKNLGSFLLFLFLFSFFQFSIAAKTIVLRVPQIWEKSTEVDRKIYLDHIKNQGERPKGWEGFQNIKKEEWLEEQARNLYIHNSNNSWMKQISDKLEVFDKKNAQAFSSGIYSSKTDKIKEKAYKKNYNSGNGVKIEVRSYEGALQGEGTIKDFKGVGQGGVVFIIEGEADQERVFKIQKWFDTRDVRIFDKEENILLTSEEKSLKSLKGVGHNVPEVRAMKAGDMVLIKGYVPGEMLYSFASNKSYSLEKLIDRISDYVEYNEIIKKSELFPLDGTAQNIVMSPSMGAVPFDPGVTRYTPGRPNIEGEYNTALFNKDIEKKYLEHTIDYLREKGLSAHEANRETRSIFKMNKGLDRKQRIKNIYKILFSNKTEDFSPKVLEYWRSKPIDPTFFHYDNGAYLAGDFPANKIDRGYLQDFLKEEHHLDLSDPKSVLTFEKRMKNLKGRDMAAYQRVMKAVMLEISGYAPQELLKSRHLVELLLEGINSIESVQEFMHIYRILDKAGIKGINNILLKEKYHLYLEAKKIPKMEFYPMHITDHVSFQVGVDFDDEWNPMIYKDNIERKINRSLAENPSLKGLAEKKLLIKKEEEASTLIIKTLIPSEEQAKYSRQKKITESHLKKMKRLSEKKVSLKYSSFIKRRKEAQEESKKLEKRHRAKRKSNFYEKQGVPQIVETDEKSSWVLPSKLKEEEKKLNAYEKTTKRPEGSHVYGVKTLEQLKDSRRKLAADKCNLEKSLKKISKELKYRNP